MRQSRAGTWLPGAPLLVVPTLHGEDSVDGTTVSFLLAGDLKLKKKEEEKERRRKLKEEAKHETRMRELDRRWKAGERLSSPDSDAWREWKSVSFSCSRSSHLEIWTLFYAPLF